MEKRIRAKYVKVRLEDDLYEALKRQAKREKRPMTRMVELYIEKGINGDIGLTRERKEA